MSNLWQRAGRLTGPTPLMIARRGKVRPPTAAEAAAMLEAAIAALEAAGVPVRVLNLNNCAVVLVRGGKWRKTMNRKVIWLTLILLLALLLNACNLQAPANDEIIFGATATAQATPSPTARANAAPTPTPATPGETSMQVCTGYPTGALNVRACPGVQCWAFFVLDEGRTVAVDGVTETAEDGATWAHIVRPVDGWVNARYLCEVK